MRLTLRTMLAYLDDCLEPDDAEQIRQKIDEHEFASNLVHRVRNSMRRLRLGAPPLEGKGMGLDPNTVAEYLDNTLDQDRIPDFERICLESDVHLAEVAACHQVLTMVLSEPAEVDAKLRQRMYHIHDSHRATGAATGEGVSLAGVAAAVGTTGSVAADAVGTGSAAGDSGDAMLDAGETAGEAAAATPKKSAEVPDYLREANRVNIWPILATLLLAFLLAAVALRAIGPFDRNHPLLQMVAGGPEPAVAENDAGGDGTTEAGGAAGDSATVSETNGTGAAGSSGSAAGASAAGGSARNSGGSENSAANDVGTPANPGEPTNTAGGASRPIEASSRDSGEPTPQPIEPAGVAYRDTGESRPTSPPPITPADPNGAATNPTPNSSAAPTVAPTPATTSTTDTPGANAPTPAEPGSSTTPPAVPSDAPAPATDVTEQQPEPTRVEVGRFLSEDQPLIRWDGSTEAWRRLAPRTVLTSGDRLVALPSFHPQLLLSTAVQMELSGPTRVTLEQPRVDEIPAVRIEEGRLLLLAIGQPGTEVYLSFGEREGTLTLETADALVAIEVRNYLPPGSDPEASTATKTVQIFGAEGEAAWTETLAGSESESVLVASKDVVAMTGDRPARVGQVSQLPNWIGDEQPTTIERLDRIAGPIVNQSLVGDRPVRLSLQEKVADRRQEVRSLAARSLALLNDFEPFFAFDDGVMRDDTQRAHWAAHFETLRRAISRGPEVAVEVRRVLEKYRPDDAAALYRMVWGYSPEQLESGEAAQLVAYLDHEDLDFRVLAFENLFAITGRTHEYAAYKPPVQRKIAVRTWQERLEEGVIAYKELPSPLPTYEQPAAVNP